MGFFEDTANQLILEGHDRRDVISFAALNCCEMLTEQEGEEITATCLAAIGDPDQREAVSRALQAKRDRDVGNWKYACAINWRKLRSERAVREQGLVYPGVEPRVAQAGHVVLVESGDDQAVARQIASHYSLILGQPASMFDVVSIRRINDEIVIALLGDDRSRNGDLWVSATFAPRRFCEMFYQDSEGLAGAFL